MEDFWSPLISINSHCPLINQVLKYKKHMVNKSWEMVVCVAYQGEIDYELELPLNDVHHLSQSHRDLGTF